MIMTWIIIIIIIIIIVVRMIVLAGTQKMISGMRLAGMILAVAGVMMFEMKIAEIERFLVY